MPRLPSTAVDGGGKLALQPPVAPATLAASVRGGGTAKLVPPTTPTDLGDTPIVGGGILSLDLRPQATLAVALAGGGVVGLASLTNARLAVDIDFGGTVALRPAGSGWSLDIDNSGDVSSVFPALSFQISLADPLAEPAWFAIDARVLGFTSGRGRTGELEEFPAGTGAISVDNKNGLFDRDNSASPLAAYLTTNRRMRIVGTWDDTDYTVVDVFADVWPMDDDPSFDSRAVTVNCTDASVFLAQQPIVAVNAFTLDDPILGVLDAGNILGGIPQFATGLSGERIREILLLIGWPEHLTDVDSGVAVVLADAPTGNVLPVLQRLARSEMGTLFVAADGTVTYRQRRAWTHITEENTPQAIFSDNAAVFGLAYTALAIDPGSRSLIKNQVTRANTAGATFTVNDPDSQATFGIISDSQTDLLTADLADLAGEAEYVAARYADGVPRIQSLTADNVLTPDQFFKFALAADIGWRATVGRTPVIGAAPVLRDVIIESVAHTVTAPESWQTTWEFIEADSTAYFTLDDALLGKLDAANSLAF